jgi:hypothetical protein
VNRKEVVDGLVERGTAFVMSIICMTVYIPVSHTLDSEGGGRGSYGFHYVDKHMLDRYTCGAGSSRSGARTNVIPLLCYTLHRESWQANFLVMIFSMHYLFYDGTIHNTLFSAAISLAIMPSVFADALVLRTSKPQKTHPSPIRKSANYFVEHRVKLIDLGS